LSNKLSKDVLYTITRFK